MEDGQYYKDGVARILELLKNTFGDGNPFRAYFNGQPEEIPESQLPCIMVSEAQGQITAGAIGTDNIEETVLIIVAFNKKDDIGASPDTDLTELKLRRIVKGMDPATQQYLPETIMYALRTHITMSDAVLESRFETDFAVNLRGQDTITQEAYISVYLKRLAMVPTRT